MQNIKHIQELLACLKCFPRASPLSIQRIVEGESHFCFKVTQGDREYFAKYIGDRESTNEVITTLLASEAGLAPEVFYHDSHWLISFFLPYDSLSVICQKKRLLDENQSTHLSVGFRQAISVAIKVMLQCHKLSGTQNVQGINFTSLIDELSNNDFISPEAFTELGLLEELVYLYDEPNNLVLCHGDINFSNILISDAAQDLCNSIENSITNLNFKLIDFECSGYADREFDIAMMFAINLIPFSYLEEVIYEYGNQYEHFFMGDSIRISKRKVTRYMVFCFYINSLWYLNKYKQQGVKAYLNQAEEQKKHYLLLLKRIKKGS